MRKFYTTVLFLIFVISGANAEDCMYCPSYCAPCSEIPDPSILNDYNKIFAKIQDHMTTITLPTVPITTYLEHTPCSLMYGELYFKCRAENDWGVKLRNEFKSGDILLIGDSLFDNMDTTFPTSLPRTHFYALGGSDIPAVYRASKYLYQYVFGTGTSPGNPSEVWVHVGGNDLGSLLQNRYFSCGQYYGDTSKIIENYELLFNQLDNYKTYCGSKIIVHSLPAFRDGQSFIPQIDTNLLNEIATSLNKYLATECTSRGYTFVDNREIFWDSYINSPYANYLADSVHLTNSGYQKWLPILAKSMYSNKVIGDTGTVASLDGPKNAPNAVSDGFEYGYAVVDVAPRQRIKAKTSSAGSNKSFIISPTAITYGASAVVASAVGVNFAEAVVNNNTDQTTTVIVCFGVTQGTGGTYLIAGEPLNNSATNYMNVNFGQSIEGNITNNTSTSGAWYSIEVPNNTGLAVTLRGSNISGSAIKVIKKSNNNQLEGSSINNGECYSWYKNNTGNPLEVLIKVASSTNYAASQKLFFSKTPNSINSGKVKNQGSSNDYMPTVASDGNGKLMCAWYRNDGSTVSLQWSESTNGGSNWNTKSQVPIVDIKPDIIYDQVNPHEIAFPPTLVFCESGWALSVPTLNGNIVLEKDLVSTNWNAPVSPAPTNVYPKMPGIGSVALPQNNLLRHDYFPHLAYRPFNGALRSPSTPRTKELLASWATWGDYLNGLSTYMDLGLGFKAPGVNIPWSAIDLSSAGYSNRSGHTIAPITAGRYINEALNSVSEDTASPSSTVWVESFNSNKLLAGPDIQVLKNLYDIRNHQIVWYSSTNPSIAPGLWVVAWSMKNQPRFGNDYDIFYSTSPGFITSWTAPQPLNQNAAIDNEDDFLGQLAGDYNRPVRAIWQTSRGNVSDINVADFNYTASTLDNDWNVPVKISPTPANAVARNPRLVPVGTSDWLHLVEMGTEGNTAIYYIK